MGRRTTLLQPPQFGVFSEIQENIQIHYVDSTIGREYDIMY